MNNINTFLRSTLAILILLSSQSLFAHYGPRGLLGGSFQIGIQYNGIVYFGTKDAGVFESTNALLVGWRSRAVGLKSGHITALTHSGAELYAATSDSGIFIFNGVIGSDRFWNKRNNGLGSLSILSLAAIDANTLIAGANGNGLYKTIDKGLNWSAVNAPLLNGKKVTALTKGGNRLFALVDNTGVFSSDDNGATWNDLNDANTSNKSGVQNFSYNAATNALLVSNTSGLFVLASASTTISPAYVAAITGLPGSTTVNSLTNNGTNWYLAANSGVYYTAASSINWSVANTNLPVGNAQVIVAVDDTLVVGLEKKGVFKSNATTFFWSDNNTGMTNINTYSLACKGDSLVVTAGEYGVTVSTNIGNGPVIVNNGLSDSLHVNDVEIGENLLFAATTNSGVFVSSNWGQSWTVQNSGLPNMNIKRVIYGSGRKYAIDANGNLFESDLQATSWTQTTNGLPSNPGATSLAFFANKIVLGTYGNGVYVKHRDSSSWIAFNTGLTDMKVTAVAYSAGKVYAGTDGSGVFVSDANTAGWSATAVISIPHFTNVPLDPSHIQYMTTVREYVIATYKGGIVGTTDRGATWVPAGNQFNLPSYTNINKVSYVTSRVFLTTETNNAQSGSTGELDIEDTILVVNETTVNAPHTGIESYHSITSNVKWKLSSSDSWVTMSVDSGLWNGTVKLTVAPHTGAAPRTATVTVTGDTIVRAITVTQQGTTGITENTINADGIRLYPNPNNGHFVLDLKGVADVHSVSILDVSGRQIREIPVLNKTTVEVSEKLLPGVYFVRIRSADGNAVKRLIIQ